MLLRWGKSGEYLVCSGKPECKNKKNVAVDADGKITIVESEAKGVCPKCGGKLVEKKGKFGRFLACSNYPECRHTEAFSLGFACPVEGCPGKLVEKTSKMKKRFISCSEYPKCSFATNKDRRKVNAPPAAPHPLLLQEGPLLPSQGLRMDITVIGGGLAGVEAAHQITRMGGRATLFEMRPVSGTPAHRTSYLRSSSAATPSSRSTSTMPTGSSRRSCDGWVPPSWRLPTGRPYRGKALVVDRDRFAARLTETARTTRASASSGKRRAGYRKRASSSSHRVR
jgi:ssDNA-binding Zn-finger/Zn-ribbon topoisomerase 1